MDMKNNFGRAMHDMFGVGKDLVEEPPAGAEASSEETPSPSMEEYFPARGEAPVLDALDDFRVEQQAVSVHTSQGTYLAAGTMMQGTLTARGDVEIAGDFEGEIVAKGKVTLHSNINSKITAMGLTLVGCTLTGDAEVSGDVSVDGQSMITGNVRAENLFCSGKIKGDLDVQDNLVLDEQAQIDGNIKADTMSVARGAKITGSVEMRNMKQ